jgi:rhodanese-related sulfurtransferase
MRVAILSIGMSMLLIGCGHEVNEATGVNPDVRSQQVEAVVSMQGFDAHRASTLLAENQNLIVLDVRTPKEYNEGHIDGAINIDFKADDFKAKLSGLDRNTPYLVHCRSGRRSTLSLAILEELGFSRITHLDGGLKGWTAAGLAVTDPCLTC